MLGLIGTVLGALALARVRSGAQATSPVATVVDRKGPAAALVLGLLSFALGGLFLATANGGPGTGNGVVGSVAAIVLGPLAIVLATRATARQRACRPADPSDGSRNQRR